jgi:hypothetical protein
LAGNNTGTATFLYRINSFNPATLVSVSCSPSSITEYNISSTPTVYCSGHFLPISNTTYNLGSSDNYWKTVYAQECNHSSDEKIKTNIEMLPLDFSKKLIMGLVPKSYDFKNSKTPRARYGFIAQDVEKLLGEFGMTTESNGLVNKSQPYEPDNENNVYSLNYTNLIAPMVKVIQSLSERIDVLEKQQADSLNVSQDTEEQSEDTTPDEVSTQE